MGEVKRVQFCCSLTTNKQPCSEGSAGSPEGPPWLKRGQRHAGPGGHPRGAGAAVKVREHTVKKSLRAGDRGRNRDDTGGQQACLEASIL